MVPIWLKFLHMGLRARRYANHRDGKSIMMMALLYQEPDALTAKKHNQLKSLLRLEKKENKMYLQMKAEHKKSYEDG